MGVRSGYMIPTSFTSYLVRVRQLSILVPFLMVPSTMLTSKITPTYGSYQESTICARNDALESQCIGGSIFSMIDGSRYSTLSPVFALTCTTSRAGSSNVDSICSSARGTFAVSRSILLITGSSLRSME
ncbi:hypothetical protein OGAPHI_006296 [Ogataea philodendri]|uniref:Uncharacterized protein n=1 Tax=Ogataea philodendri TaxID=1378263 RepID=A0A9P8NYJ1_9ASCO|nr:uncharacterized protein OGAPHI_006296 [Ogataea philodendri]KAH3662115.1 hypothetical protein OGAPHI_006296 [Ogataea philodendri]